jgi:hypothetical protein
MISISRIDPRRTSAVILLALISLIAPAAGQTNDRPGDDRDLGERNLEKRDLGERDLIEYAGGRLQFRLPRDWRLTETVRQREVWLLLTPGRPPESLARLDDGIWIVFRPQLPSDQHSTNDRAIDFFGPNVKTNEIAELPIDRRPMHRSAVVVSADPNFDRPELRGAYLHGAAGAAQFELALVAPAPKVQLRLGQLDDMLATIRFRAAKDQDKALADSQSGAKEIVGAWKSLRGKMRILGDGRIVVRTDSATPRPIDAGAPLLYEQKGVELVGRYEARGDVLRIVWTDGSRTNYRWRLVDGELFLTDHVGQTSQLRPMFD